MNLKKAKEIANKTIKGLFSQAKKMGASAEAISKADAFAKKAGTAVKLGKTLTGLVEINLIDTTLGSIPVINELWAALGTASDWINTNTFEKIPGVGQILFPTEVRRKVQKTVLPKAFKYVNDPKYYENTDMHQAWSIPFNFPDTDYLDYGPGINYGSIAVVDFGYNYLADQYAIQSRTTQVFDLLKGIRGLSGKQPYSTGDLYYYHRNCEYLVNEYCRLKFALRLSQVYILTKSRMPVNLLTALGWNAEDFISNKALYQQALIDLGNFITNNVPMYGVQLKRIYGLWDQLIPDSNDGKVALFYKVDLHIHTMIPQSSGSYDTYCDGFSKGTTLSGGTTIFSTDDLRLNNMTFSIYLNQMLAYISAMNSNDQFNPIRADIIAAFGKSSIWADSKINQINDTKYDDLIGPYDELFLSQIQNATLLVQKGFNNRGNVLSPTEPTTLYAIRQQVTIGVQNSDGSFPFPISTVGNNGIVTVDYRAYNPDGTAKQILLPMTDGAARLISGNSLFTDSTIVIANKYDMKESEQIELVQLLAFAIGETSGYADTGYDLLSVDYITNTFYAERVRLLYFNPSNKTDLIVDLASYATRVSDAIQDYSMEHNANVVKQFWSQMDYGPKLAFTNYNENYANVNNTLLLDFNIMGSISKSAFKQEIRYSAYSLNAADIKITEAKKLNNIVNVYTMK